MLWSRSDREAGKYDFLVGKCGGLELHNIIAK
jgi:hypothetical protein